MAELTETTGTGYNYVETDAVRRNVYDRTRRHDGTAVALAQAAEEADTSIESIEIEESESGVFVRVVTTPIGGDGAPVPRPIHNQLDEWGYDPDTRFMADDIVDEYSPHNDLVGVHIYRK